MEAYLYDELFAATYRFKKLSQKLRLGVREQIRKSVRFVLDNEAVETVYRASVPYEHGERNLQLSRLPHPDMWVEFDLRHKVKVSQDVQIENGMGHLIGDRDLSDVPYRMGFQFREIDKITGAWECLIYVLLAQDKDNVGFPYNQWVICPEKNLAALFNHGEYMKRRHLYSEKVDLISDIEAYGFGYTDPFTRKVHMTPWIKDSAIMFPSAAAEELIKMVVDEQRLRQLQQYIHDEIVIHNRGIVRFICCLLASINSVPNEITYYTPKQGRRYAGINSVPYLGHSTIVLKLPKKNKVKYLLRMTKKADARRRAHQVRGHYRLIDRGIGIKCSHSATAVVEGVGLCTKCGRRIRWIPAHVRGDATLGWVSQQYVVEGK